MTSPTVNRAMLRDQLREILLAGILEARYAPGERLVETQIAEELGVSKAPVREAIRELEILGMVVSEPFRGSRVREVTSQELAESYPVRAAIEEVAAREAFPWLNADPSPLYAEIEAMAAAAARGDLHNVLIHDVQFHRIIVEAAESPRLAAAMRAVAGIPREFRTAFWASDQQRAQSLFCHRELVAALGAKEPELAGAVMRMHILGAVAFLEETWPRT